jgi:nitroimidazol reductase NimA-like FMN-containing flavoprotein (pyridoxamine 5'-phosphate oxidase superfamily)
MSDDPAGATRGPADSKYLGPPTIWAAHVEHMDEAECLRLISAGGVGRIAYSGQFGLAVLPVSYKVLEGSIVVRTPLGSTTDEDLRTGIRGADYRVAFEIDQVDRDAEEGWFIVIRGPARHVEADDDCLSAWLRPTPPSDWRTPEHFVRITPSEIVGRRLRPGELSEARHLVAQPRRHSATEQLTMGAVQQHS